MYYKFIFIYVNVPDCTGYLDFKYIKQSDVKFKDCWFFNLKNVTNFNED